MFRKISVMFAFVAMAFSLVVSPAMAAVTFDAATGTGFVGKGDVQLALNLNNKQLQDQASGLSFAAVSTVVSERTWTCTNTNNENTQGREQTTTTSITGVVSAVARERNQITGFNLNGYDGTPSTSSTTAGNQLNSCPSGPWTLTTPAGAPVVDPELSKTVVTVNGVALN
jgi:hypothetical protein